MFEVIPAFAVFPLANAIVSLFFAIVMIWCRGDRGAMHVLALMTLVCIWSAGRFAEALAYDAQWRIFWAQAQYLGIAFVAPAWLRYCADYASEERLLRGHVAFALGLIALFNMLVAWTNQLHGLYWSTIKWSDQIPGTLVFVKGPLFYAALLFNYACIAIGACVLIRHVLRLPRAQRRQHTSALASVLAPFVLNLIYALGLSPLQSLDLTPFGLTLCGLLWIPRIVQRRIYGIAPAHNAVLTTARDGVITLDADGLVTSINGAATRLLGALAPVVGQRWRNVQTRPGGGIIALAGADGVRHCDVITAPITAGRDDIGELIMLRDLTELVEAREHAERLNAELERRVDERTRMLSRLNLDLESEVALRTRHEAEARRLAYRLTTAEEQERRRLASELHDGVGANLSGIGLLLGRIRAQLDPAQRARADEAATLVKETTAHVRGVLRELRPPALDDYGIVAALREAARAFSGRCNARVSVRCDALQFRLGPSEEMALFRIAQEAINNACKHAQASHVDVDIALSADALTLRIRDDGCGFDVRERDASQPTWGLATMRERASGIGGVCVIESAPGGGTVVTATVPRALVRDAADPVLRAAATEAVYA